MLFSFISVSTLLLLGRISGFIREWLIAFIGGANQNTDIALILITLPDLMVTLLIGGGFVSSLVPILQNLNPSEATKLYLHLLSICTVFFIGVAVSMAIFAEEMILLLHPGLNSIAISLAMPFFILVTLAIPITAISGVSQAHLTAHKKYWYSSSGTLIFNTCIILAILFSNTDTFLKLISMGIIAGVTFRLLLQIIGLKNTVSTPHSKKKLISKKLFKDLTVTTYFAATLALLPIIGRSFASFTQDGGLSLFSYTFRIVELPTTLIYASLATVLLPVISNSFRKKTLANTLNELSLMIRFAFLSGFAVLIPALFFASDFIFLLFSETNLSEEQLNTLVHLFMISISFFPFRGFLFLSLSIMPAIEQAKKLVVTATVLLIAIFIFSFLLQSFQITGTILSYGVAHIIGAIVIGMFLTNTFGIQIINKVFNKFYLTYVFPSFVSILICLTGLIFFNGWVMALIFSIFSITTFAILITWIDPNARAVYSRIKKKVFRKQPYD